MMFHSLRASSSFLSRVGRQQTLLARRTFSVSTAIRQPDLIQDMYLKELRAYKPPQVKASDAEGHVQKFAVPKAPKSPEEADIASDLQSYENQQVEVEGQAATGETSAVEQDWFEEEEEAEAAHGGH